MTTITVTFDPPLPSDSPATFNSKAFDTLGDLNTWSGQANTVAGEVNTNATNAATSAGTASTHASTATTKAGEANASAVAAAASASSASTSAGTATTKASEADASAIAAAASAASIAPGSLLTTANPSYTGTLTGGTGVVNLGSGQFVKDAAGNVGLGVTPSAGGDIYYRRIELGKAGCGIAAATNSLTTSELSYFTNNAVITYTGANPWKYGNDGAAGYYAIEDGQHKWGVAPGGTAGNPITFTQAMTLDASGNLLVGATSIGRAANASGIYFGGSSLLPSTGTALIDAGNSLGTAAWRWTTVYATTGAINTSDAREKTAVRAMAADEIEAAKALSKEIGVYQFLASVEAKGDKARHHIGMTVQRAIEIMQHHGLDPFSYGFICYDKWGEETKEHPAVEAREAVEAKDAVLDDEGNVVEPAVEAQPAIEAKDAWTEVTLKAGDRYSFRYDQLTLFIARGIDARLAALEAAT